MILQNIAIWIGILVQYEENDIVRLRVKYKNTESLDRWITH